MITELSFYDANIPCLAACPVHTNAGAYVAAIADGDDLTAYLTARLPNPFASVCGRVCAAPCEDACRRAEIDAPIAIRALKRFVTEKYGVEAGPGSRWEVNGDVSPASRAESVAIVGGGPTGLSAAHDLRRYGYEVVVHEATAELGGMMLLGIPEYRLDRRLLKAEIKAITDLGIDVTLNSRLGRDFALEDLRRRHDAVYLAMGATLGRGLDIEGADAEGVLKAIEFLININLGFRVDIGERVVVVGGGNVAMDAARTALRASAYASVTALRPGDTPGARAEGRAGLTEAVDVARSAVRAGAKEVTVVALEAREEMPAAEFEIEEAEAEGIRFIHRRGPAAILVDDGRAVGLDTMGVRSVFDELGRFAPVFDHDDRSLLEADTVILAIGQAVDVDALGQGGPDLTAHRTIAVDDSTLKTSLASVWAGGDAAYGPRNLIDAIADGRRAARSIHAAFGGESVAEPTGTLISLGSFHRYDDEYDRVTRLPIPALDSDRRIGLREVELGFSEEQARLEAARCLRCFANIQLSTEACVLCGLCADVCPTNVISLVPSESVLADGGGNTALLLDERACIRCGLCIERCPTRALSMSVWEGVGIPA